MKDKLNRSPDVFRLEGVSGLIHSFNIYNIDDYAKIEADSVVIFTKRVIDENQHTADQKAQIFLLIYSVPEEIPVGSLTEVVKPIDADFVMYRYTPDQSERTYIINDIKATDYYSKQRAYLSSLHK